jgi:RNA-directed DNA polymerase
MPSIEQFLLFSENEYRFLKVPPNKSLKRTPDSAENLIAGTNRRRLARSRYGATRSCTSSCCDCNIISTHSGYCRIKPAKKNVKEFLAKVRAIIKKSQYGSAGQLIEELNPVIRGWANYHRHVVSKKTFEKVDHDIFQALWRWAKRRHRRKGARWVRAKYFGRYWVFFGWGRGRNGTRRKAHLFRAAKVPIVRHVKIRAAANPYDPEWEHYFEKRLDAKMAADWEGRQSLLRLWFSQDGNCPVCRKKITRQTGWENHHVTARVHGGSDTMENRVLLHPTCHRQVHSLGLTVLKRRPTRGR